jgi:hypothetical protein
VAIAEPVDPAPSAQESVPRAVPITAARAPQRTSTMRPRGAELGRRVAILLFGLIQVVIVLRVVLLVLDAREGNFLVSGILNASQVFVAPFNGVLHTNALQSGGSILDLAAIVALVGWTVLELIVLWVIGIFRPETA